MNVEAPFQLRETVTEDIDSLIEFLKPFVDAQQLLPRSLGEMLTLSRNGFVAEVGGEIIGFAAIEIYSRKLAEIQCLAVDGRFQGKGVGKQLVARCIQRAKELHVVELMAISASDEFLKMCGFDYSLPSAKRALFISPMELDH